MKNAVILILSIVVLTVSGCGKVKSFKQHDTFDQTPEDAALNFFDALYNKKDLATVLKLATPRYSKLLKSYAAISTIQRHVINLSYDKVTIKLDSGNSTSVRAEYAKDSTVIVFLTGTYFDKKIDDIRIAKMVKLDGHWRVKDVITQNYSVY